MLPRALATLVVLTVLAITGAGLPPADGATRILSGDTDVRGDDERDAYVGTGGLLLPTTIDNSTRRAVATCPDCRWRMATPCAVPGPGNAFDGQSTCLSVVRGCPGGQLLRTWFESGGEPWRDVGLVCVGDEGPVTVTDVSRAVRARFERGIPALTPGFQPAQGILTQIPVVFDSGQSAGDRSWQVDLLGRSVSVVATPVWRWRFGDGAALATVDPGGRYPHLGVAHAYRRAGVFRAECTTTWSAMFSVDGLGPFPVSGPVEQHEARWIWVGEGRALLTPDRTARARPRG